MSRRRPSKAELNAVITLDLLGDPSAYAGPLPEPQSESDWRYYGTITRNGVTGALAWRAGWFGIGKGATISECGLWDRIKISNILEFENPPGLEGRPKFTPLVMLDTGKFFEAERASKQAQNLEQAASNP